MKLTRELRVQLTDSAESYARNSAHSWSGWPETELIVPFVVVRATLDGPVDRQTGFVCDVKVVDRALRHAVAACVERASLQTSHAEFIHRLWQQLDVNTTLSAPLDALDTAYSPYLRFRKTQESPNMVTVTQQYEFSAAHRLHCPELSDAENQALFGKCNNLNGHGHNYLLEVSLESEPGPAGRVFSLAEMNTVVRQRVIDRFDHQHLNEDTDEFKQRNPTVENIAATVFGLLEDQFAPARLTGVRLYETPKTWVDVTL